MNTSIIRYLLGCVLKIEAVLMLLPFLVGILYGEHEAFAYLITFALCGILGILLTIKKMKSTIFYLKEGCVATSLSWIVLSVFGCLPFLLTGEIPKFHDALFETISGFTTTGASILNEVESLSHCTLFWRSFTHWIGGMGVLVFLLAIIPLSGGSNINLMRAESPGPSVGKLVPKIRYTARLLYAIYLILTITQIVFLLLGKMPLFDALTTTFGTAGTGGFGIKNNSIAGYSPYIQWVVTIFMVLFGVNFNAYYFVFIREFKKVFSIEEVRCYFLILLCSTLIIFLNILQTGMNAADCLRHAAFQTSSIMTSTGFATADFNLWPEASKSILVLLMFIGACAGSTGGGIKVSRILIMIKTLFKELHSYIHPKSIMKVKMDGKPVEHEVVRAINVYFISFLFLFTLSVLAISFEGHDLVTNFTAVIATLNNIGPGLELVGPTGNFGFFSVASKYILMFDMLAGRLELFPLFILFHPNLWIEMIHSKRKVHE